MRFRSNRHIPSVDVKKMIRFLHDLHEIDSTENFGGLLVQLLDDLMPGSHIVFDEINQQNGTFQEFNNYKLSESVQRKFYESVFTFYAQKPIIRYLQKGGKEKVIRNSDIMSPRELARTDIYHHALKPLECDRQLYVLLPVAGYQMKFFVSRDREFSEEVVEMFRLLVDHVALAYCNAQKITALRQADSILRKPISSNRLTPRETEILHWIQQGKRNGEIGIILGISERTVEKHVENILRKLKVETRTSAIAQAEAFRRTSNS